MTDDQETPNRPGTNEVDRAIYRLLRGVGYTDDEMGDTDALTAVGLAVDAYRQLRADFDNLAAVAARRDAAGYAEAVARLRDDARYTNWWSSSGCKPDGPIRRHLADYLETVGPDGIDVTTGRWPAREQRRAPKPEELVDRVAQAMRDANTPDAWTLGPQLVPFHHFAKVAIDAMERAAGESQTDVTASPFPRLAAP